MTIVRTRTSYRHDRRTIDSTRLGAPRSGLARGRAWVVSEIIKAHRNAGIEPRLSFFRDAHGLEVDVLVERVTDLVGIEVKSGATVPLETFAPLEAVARLVPELRTRLVVHGGGDSWTTTPGRAVSYRELDRVEWTKI